MMLSYKPHGTADYDVFLGNERIGRVMQTISREKPWEARRAGALDKAGWPFSRRLIAGMWLAAEHRRGEREDG